MHPVPFTHETGAALRAAREADGARNRLARPLIVARRRRRIEAVAGLAARLGPRWQREPACCT